MFLHFFNLKKAFLAVLLISLIGLLLLQLSTREGQTSLPSSNFFEHIRSDWLTHEYWFDGRAELNFYQATLVKYGIPRKADQVVHILVTEKHRPDLLVKADDWHQPGLVDMLKFNYVISVQTGIYAYRQMMSVFFDQKSARTAKMTFTSHEWCGNAYKSLINFRGREKFYFDTYWDGQGRGEYNVQYPPDLVLYDALPVQLRMLDFSPALKVTLTILPTQISSKVSPPTYVQGRLEVGEITRHQVPAGTFAVYPVILEYPDGQDEFYFEAAFPHRMIEWLDARGNRYQLVKSEKLAYWELNRPGDEAYLP